MSRESELYAFLRARLDDTERKAKAAAGAPWAVEVPPMVHVSVQARRDAKWKWGHLGYVATVERDEDRAHIAEHDPARVLAEVDAVRELLRVAEGSHDHHVLFMSGVSDALTGVLRRFAAAYAGHEDYREEWRP